MTINRQGADRAFMAGRRNLIINGGFRVWQRGTSFTAQGYTADRWFAGKSGTNFSLTKGGLGATATQDAASGYINLKHAIEWDDWLYGRTFTASFRATSPDGISLQAAVRDGTVNGAATIDTVILDGLSLLTPVSGDRYEVTFTVPASATGTPTMLRLSISGNVFGGNTASLDVGEVQLEEGSVASNFEHRPLGEELALCQRYFVDLLGGNSFSISTSGFSNSSTVFRASQHFPQTMRAQPSVTASSAAHFLLKRPGVADEAPASMSFSNVGPGGFLHNHTMTTAGTAGDGTYMVGNSASAKLTADAEL